jgi:adhesin transport system outer membrane protein
MLKLKQINVSFSVSLIMGLAFFSSAYSDNAHAAERLTLSAAVETAILTNPEVLQSYKNYEAAVKDREAAFGRYLPTVDVTSSFGSESRQDPLVSRLNGNSNYTRNQSTIALKQMIFDGFATRSEVERLDRSSKARLYELENVSQAIASEATRAYIDLIRFRALTVLAEDNYVAHKIIFEQLQQKANAGVGKKSDVDQAQSRLFLADYNLNVEGSNLHDIESRYLRLVGNLPPKNIDSKIALKKDIPADAISAINKAQLNNASLLATIEDTLSQAAMVENKKAAFMPKVDFRARADRGQDLNGFAGSHRNDVAEVVMTWNLFNGLTDINLKRRDQATLEALTNRRDKTCRDIRQEIQIAYNDVKKLTEQETFLDTRVIAIEKARDAYRKQFDIGQRTLVDLLNSENELFEAKRLYTNITHDVDVAYARTHLQMGTLLNALGLSRYASKEAPLTQVASNDGANIAACPAEAATTFTSNREYLDSRAREVLLTPKKP